MLHKYVNKLVVPMFQTESMAEPKDIGIVALSDLITSITNDTNFCNMLSIERLLMLISIIHCVHKHH